MRDVFENVYDILTGDVNSIEFIVSEENILLQEGHLGISFELLFSLFKYAETVFLKANSSLEAEKASKILLMINADHYTAWNQRKQLLVNGDIVFPEELRFVSVLLTKHPKSGELWAHRRWVLSQMNTFDPSEEIRISQKAAERYSKNYSAWTHRLWILKRLEHLLIPKEWSDALVFAQLNVSQFCAWHYIQQIWLRMDEINKGDSALVELDDTNRELLLRLSGHESLWVHRRFIWFQKCKRKKTRRSFLFEKQLVSSILKNSDSREKDEYFASKYLEWISLQIKL